MGKFIASIGILLMSASSLAGRSEVASSRTKVQPHHVDTGWNTKQLDISNLNIVCNDKHADSLYPVIVRLETHENTKRSRLKIGNEQVHTAFWGGIKEPAMTVVWHAEAKYIETKASNLIINADSFEPISLVINVKTGKGSYSGPVYSSDGSGIRSVVDYDVNCTP